MRERLAAAAAVRAVARAELRTRWRGIVVLGLLLGLAGGVVLAAGAVADRTRTAYPRLEQAVGLDDARVLLPADRPALTAAVPALPGVARSRLAASWVARLDGREVRYVSVGAGLDPPSDLVRPVVVEGREPRPDAADELLISEPLAEVSGLRVGTEITLRLLTAEEIGMFDVGFGEPDGAVVRMRIVGMGRMPEWGDGLANMLASPAFARVHAGTEGALGAFVRLADREPATREAFAAGLAAADAADPAVSVLADYVQATPDFPTAQVDPAIRTAERVLVTGLAVFGAVVALGGLLVVGQGLARHHAERRDTQRIEAALGLTRGERVAARVLVAAVGALVAGLVGAAVAVAAGLLEPLGSQARFEPTPGFRPSWTIAAAGGAGLAVLFLVLAAATAARAGGRRTGAAGATGPAVARIGRWPAVALGVRMAWSGRRGGGIPAVATVLGAGLALAGIVATATFGAGLARVVDTPARYGFAGDITLADAREPDVAALVADDRVDALDLATGGSIQLAGDAGPIDAISLEHRKGAMPVETAAGRPPSVPGEIAVGPRTASRLGLDVGDRIEVLAPSGPVPVVVTGVVVVQSVEYRSPLGDGALLVPAQLPELVTTTPLVSALIRAAPGQRDALFADLASRLEVFGLETPDAVRNLADLRLLPELLAAVLGVVTAAGLAHVLLTAGRRRAPDVAVLAVLGGTPGQVRGALAVMAAATVLPALAVGVPLGLAVGRVLWWQVATATGVAGDVALPGPLLVALTPVALLVALLLAVAPAVRATRTPPAVVLAAE